MKQSSLIAAVSCVFFAGTTSAYLVDPPTTAASDTISDCSNWFVATASATCAGVATDWGITVQQYTTYNPSLAKNSCKMTVGNSYCTEQNWGIPPDETTTTTSTTTSAGPTTTGNGITTPTPTQDGMTKSCNKFYFVVQGDGCTSIQTKFSITFAQLFSWNPAIGSNCESLWLNTNICVGVIGGATTTTKTSATTTTTSGNGITTPTPTQDGMTKNCNKFYLVVSGDGCTSIQTKYSITFAQLFGWNPAIGSNCESLWLNTYVCVGVIGQTTTPTTSKTTTSTTTKTGNGITTPTPTQDGMNPNCDRFYMVVSGDGCQKIADQFSIDLSQFYSWNPAVGNTCSSLWLNTYVCVHVIGATTKPTSTTKTTSTTTQGNGIATPTPTQANMVKNCNRFYKVVSGDSCQGVADKNKITLANFYKWNPDVGNTCASLWLDTYMCVGVIS